MIYKKKKTDLFAKWYVRDGQEFLSDEEEIEPEGVLHGKKVITPIITPSRTSSEHPTDNITALEDGGEEGGDPGSSRRSGSAKVKRERSVEEGMSSMSMCGCPFSGMAAAGS